MQSGHELESGVLPSFRLFIGIQLALTALALSHLLAAPLPLSLLTVSLTAHSILEPALLLLYLSLPALRRTLRTWYLPLGIVWAAAGPILDLQLSLSDLHATGSAAPGLHAQLLLWRQLILLLIPLVILSWQYTMREVILFCALTAALNITLLAASVGVEQLLTQPLIGVIAVQTVSFYLVGQMVVQLMNVQRQQRRGLSEANRRLAQYASSLEQLTISRERNRLARELHDVLAHTLSGVAVELEGVRATLRPDPERASVLLSHSLQAIREGLSETRRAVQELRARPLEALGLALAMRTLAESYADRSGFAVELEIDRDIGDEDVEVQQCVYRIAEEALNNIAEHAQAQKVKVILRRDGGQLRLTIRDDGCGFDPNGGAARDQRYGLLGMRERSDLLGGSLAITSRIGEGTQVSFSYGGPHDG
jgi:signal transduction histidine kinase